MCLLAARCWPAWLELSPGGCPLANPAVAAVAVLSNSATSSPGDWVAGWDPPPGPRGRCASGLTLLFTARPTRPAASYSTSVSRQPTPLPHRRIPTSEQRSAISNLLAVGCWRRSRPPPEAARKKHLLRHIFQPLGPKSKHPSLRMPCATVAATQLDWSHFAFPLDRLRSASCVGRGPVGCRACMFWHQQFVDSWVDLQFWPARNRVHGQETIRFESSKAYLSA
jgi:hypothetical protein